jgi:16S rRNA C1402 (ribose-2'-O) methylase RsmI
VVRGPLSEIAEQLEQRDDLKGEVVVLVGPPAGRKTAATYPEVVDEELVRSLVARLISEGATRTAAVKQVARELGIERNTVYDLTMGRKGET